MRVVKAHLLAAVAGIAALTAIPASAAELGFYVGFMYGDSEKEFDRENFSLLGLGLYDGVLGFSPEQRSFSTSSDGESYGFFAGYRLNQYLAFEGGYSYIGKQSYRETASGFFFPAEGEPQAETWALSLSSRTSGFELSALGILPISYSWEVYARAGVLIASNTLSVYASNGNLLFADQFNESSSDWLAGMGISWSLAEVYAIRAEFKRIFGAGKDVFGEADLDLVSIGVTVSF